MPLYRVSVGLGWNGEGAPGANVWSLRTVSSTGTVDLEAGLTKLKAFYAALANYYAVGVTATVPEDVVRIDTDPPESVAFTQSTTAGSGSGGEAPEMLAVCLNWKTTARTRSGTGRTFIGPLRKDFIDTDGTPANNMVDALLAAAANLIDSQSSFGWGAFGVYSRVQALHRDFKAVSARKDQFSVLRSRRD